ncbi:HesA/MoeB/ThiF family protein [Chryseobacterium indologenes]|uniref:HesA/MoeB/ThiF family protein n=1 Tax=Chryseobacterium indologenes TaxID=253 RepID=UPI0003E06E86|nr:HesA/MoeB/ThiF family protein [Chryseobacterium indologenes]QPQ52962.1 HesA/MoeB/ThiF family protein [Chryseobacterium indologenes]GAE66644.1 molybdopterin biosynthesis protein MoeB [Chryseobacterium indologenes NBRC 14944]SFK24079.1 adenylyltransferase and sulfurtransferase [Chryseobacterium indologenes]SUX51731.1 Probable adenylyltransferase/sulfurtransferase MoeZ [Chryseobacterium indologenes]
MQSDDTFKRYSRQIFIEEIGLEGQRKILASKVLVVGAGGLGSSVIQYLAAAGVGTLAVADFDHVELHNLNRQVIHDENRVGSKKVESAGHFVRNLNHQIKFVAIDQKINEKNVREIVSQYDLVVDGSDNFSTRYLLNDTCVQLGKTLVYGSILGFTGQVAVFNCQGSKNLRDIFPESPLDEDIPDCDSLGVLGALPGIIGSMMALQALKIITDLTVNINQITLVDTMNWRFQTLDF